MPLLCDTIEQFIVRQIEESHGKLDFKRNTLAADFGCAPSQISYVLQTRFTPARGYMTQSRRGGGGYVRIIRIEIEETSSVLETIESELSGPISEGRASAIISGLLHGRLISRKDAALMKAAISKEALSAAGAKADRVRSSILSQMLKSTVLMMDENASLTG